MVAFAGGGGGGLAVAAAVAVAVGVGVGGGVGGRVVGGALTTGAISRDNRKMTIVHSTMTSHTPPPKDSTIRAWLLPESGEGRDAFANQPCRFKGPNKLCV